jgi:hypothetical protein
MKFYTITSSAGYYRGHDVLGYVTSIEGSVRYYVTLAERKWFFPHPPPDIISHMIS